MFYAIHNNYVLHKTVVPFDPWTFVPTVQVSEQIRHDKESRQDFYRNINTQWCFYTAFEGANPNQRISKEDNPPRLQSGFAADFDMEIPLVRVHEVIAAMKIKPAWIEISLGRKIRLVWLFDSPLRVDSVDFAMFFLRKAMKWLRLDLLPGLDEGAFLDPARLLANGAEWIATGHGTIDANQLQAFYVETAREFRFKSTDPTEVPLDIIEAKIKEQYPKFDWPTEFVVDSQGPSFWVPGSTSTMSALVKKEGMFTFSDHAEKSFYSWGDILGKDFIKGYADNAISKATKDIYYDKKNYWRKIEGDWDSMPATEMQIYLEVECGLSTKPDKSGRAPLKVALSHIHNTGRIIGAGPFVFCPPGPMIYQGRRVLNTFQNKVIRPVSGPQVWGAEGNFPFISAHFDFLFDPVVQKDFFIAWLKHGYMAAIDQVPRSGCHVYLMGKTNMGKTLTGRGIVGKLLGGFVDASGYMLGNTSFTSELHEVPIWCIDDDTSSENPQSHARFQAIWKKVAANQEFLHNKKFEVPLTIVHPVRIVCTLNMDVVSSRVMGSLDDSSLDKTNLFRCASECKIKFPPREVTEKIIDKELPYFGRWLIDHEPPEHVEREVRYGYKSYQDESLLDRARQSGKSAPFKALLIECLRAYFQREPKATEWRGPVPALIRELQFNPGNETVLRLLRLEQTDRYLEMIQREGLLKCRTETGAMKVRLWVFPRFDDMPIVTTQAPAVPVQGEIK